jgi:hypothetical protein
LWWEFLFTQNINQIRELKHGYAAAVGGYRLHKQCRVFSNLEVGQMHEILFDIISLM